MARRRILGSVQPLQKVWLTKKELCKYLGVSERYVETTINPNPKVKMFQLSSRTVLYSRENIDAVVMAAEI